jgi:hypothetical protein
MRKMTSWPKVLELPHLVDQHGVPEVQVGRRRVEAGLDAQRAASAKALLEFLARAGCPRSRAAIPRAVRSQVSLRLQGDSLFLLCEIGALTGRPRAARVTQFCSLRRGGSSGKRGPARLQVEARAPSAAPAWPVLPAPCRRVASASRLSCRARGPVDGRARAGHADSSRRAADARRRPRALPRAIPECPGYRPSRCRAHRAASDPSNCCPSRTDHGAGAERTVLEGASRATASTGLFRRHGLSVIDLHRC